MEQGAFETKCGNVVQWKLPGTFEGHPSEDSQ